MRTLSIPSRWVAGLSALVGLVAVFALTSPHARGQGAKPAPGCAGMQVEDRRGDVSAAAGPTATNLDITGGFFTTDPAGVVTAHIQVANMSTMPPPPATAVSWFMVWVSGTTTHFVSLEADVAGNTVYEYGTVGQGPTGNTQYTRGGDTKGTVHNGPDGVISIVVPKAAKGAVGSTLATPRAESFQLVQNGLGGGVLLFGDETAEGTDYTAGACELPGGGGAGGGGAGGGGAGGGSGPGSGAGGGPPSTPRTPQAAPRLPVALVTKTVKRPRGRALVLKVRAKEAVKQLGARVRKGKRVLGTGKRASLRKGATVTVKVRLKGRAKRGTYRLDMTGRLADGRLASGGYRLKIR